MGARYFRSKGRGKRFQTAPTIPMASRPKVPGSGTPLVTDTELTAPVGSTFCTQVVVWPPTWQPVTETESPRVWPKVPGSGTPLVTDTELTAPVGSTFCTQVVVWPPTWQPVTETESPRVWP